jgi:hypothetical protein
LWSELVARHVNDLPGETYEEPHKWGGVITNSTLQRGRVYHDWDLTKPELIGDVAMSAIRANQTHEGMHWLVAPAAGDDHNGGSVMIIFNAPLARYTSEGAQQMSGTRLHLFQIANRESGS